MKILWHSVAPWVGTGYGQQTAQATSRIKALGHDVGISAYYGLAGTTLRWQGMKVYPAYNGHYGSDTVVPHAIDHFGGGEGQAFREVADRGLILTLGDVWCFEQPLLSQMNVAAWAPIDHETIPAQVAAWFEMTGAIPIAMSRFGQRALAQRSNLGFSGAAEPLYVPHGIDTSVFCPGDKAQARERVGLPADAFVVAMVANNIGRDGNRKSFSEQITAFGHLLRKHPDAVLALHTDVQAPLGMDLLHLLSDFPETSYMFTDQYAYRVGVPATTVADIYRAADVLTNCSWGEGFGVPIVEAQACGTPVVVTDTTAMPELVGAGWKVPGEPMWHDSANAWLRRPLIAGIVDAYEQAYDQARDDTMRAQAWAFAQDYDADRVLEEHWKPTLVKLEAALEARRDDHAKPKPVRPQVREADGLVWLDRGAGFGDWLGWQAHEEPLKPVIENLMPDGGVFLDVGAHIGHWALRLAGKASHVHAVEPNPETVAVLRRHIAMNDLHNVDVYEMAAWDEKTTLHLEDPNHEVAGGSTRTLTEADGVAVQADRLDDVLNLDRLDLVKLDVEGADLQALRGMARLIDKHRPTLFIEDHSVYGYFDRADLDTLLAEMGYESETVFWYGTTWHPDGTRKIPARADYLVCRPVG